MNTHEDMSDEALRARFDSEVERIAPYFGEGSGELRWLRQNGFRHLCEWAQVFDRDSTAKDGIARWRRHVAWQLEQCGRPGPGRRESSPARIYGSILAHAAISRELPDDWCDPEEWRLRGV